MDHIFGFFYPNTPLIEYDTKAKFFRERLLIFSYAQIGIVMLYSWYVSYEQAFLQMLVYFIILSCYKSMYYYTCIILTVIACIHMTFIITSKTVREQMPDALAFIVVIYHFLLVYYSYQANRSFRYHFDRQFGEQFGSLKEFFQIFNESQAFEKYLKQKQYYYQQGQDIQFKKDLFYNPDQKETPKLGGIGSILDPLVDNILTPGNTGIDGTKSAYLPLLNDPRTN